MEPSRIRVLDEATAPSDLLRATTPRRRDTQPMLQTPSSTVVEWVGGAGVAGGGGGGGGGEEVASQAAASHQICITAAIRSMAAGEHLALRRRYIMQSKAPGKDFE
ncbi:hypothetical protein Trco_006807 [Trichoderma cornu-damae]|uniref:Uncharacterized protein n=1 Tax=Trichoderma cornu-damae TaxID=654480 RepID=A0A9P8QL23_9HYPO|nr:hypothetical protein Trco_006807 [Trichoderma cornu-damae]